MVFSRLDIVTEAEYPKMYAAQKNLVALITDAVVMQMLKPGGTNIDEHGPFIEGDVWKRFTACRTWLGRVCVLTMGKVPNARFWWKDRTAMEALRIAIGESRLEEVMRMPIGRLNAAWSCFQADMLDSLRATLAQTSDV